MGKPVWSIAGVTAARRMPWTLVSCPKLQAAVLHSDPAFDAAPECVSREVRKKDAIGFEDVAGAAGEIGGVKVHEAQNDVVRREFAFPLDDSRGKRSFAAQINSSQRHFRSAKSFTDIQQVQPGAIAVGPVRRFEILVFACRSKCERPTSTIACSHRKAIAAGGEFRREVRRHWHIAPTGKLNRVPIDCPKIQRMLRSAAGGDIQPQIARPSTATRERKLL